MARLMNVGSATPGCVTKALTMILHPNTYEATAHLKPNSTYRVVAEEDSIIDFHASGVADDAAGDLSAASGVYLPKDSPEYFTTTGDKVYITSQQATASGAIYVSLVLGRGV